MKTLSFNQWLTGTQKFSEDANIRLLANLWVPIRGRLTEASVEKRAQTEYGQSPGIGMHVYRIYRIAVSAPPPRHVDAAPESSEPVSASLDFHS